MKQRKLVIFCMAVSLTVSGVATAGLIRVSQESSAGAGDFDANVLGNINTYNAGGLTLAAFYQYGTPDYASYNGQLNGGPTPVSSQTSLFLVEGSDGLGAVVVHDKANDSGGGGTNVKMTLSGDTFAPMQGDDPAEGLTLSGGGTVITAIHNWAPCCTDGFVAGTLDGSWSLTMEFNARPTGIDTWAAVDSSGSDIGLVLATGRRVRLDVAPVPVPGAAILGFLGLATAGTRLRKRRNLKS